MRRQKKKTKQRKTGKKETRFQRPFNLQPSRPRPPRRRKASFSNMFNPGGGAGQQSPFADHPGGIFAPGKAAKRNADGKTGKAGKIKRGKLKNYPRAFFLERPRL